MMFHFLALSTYTSLYFTKGEDLVHSSQQGRLTHNMAFCFMDMLFSKLYRLKCFWYSPFPWMTFQCYVTRSMGGSINTKFRCASFQGLHNHGLHINYIAAEGSCSCIPLCSLGASGLWSPEPNYNCRHRHHHHTPLFHIQRAAIGAIAGH
jgi:hypothetical protein